MFSKTVNLTSYFSLCRRTNATLLQAMKHALLIPNDKRVIVVIIILSKWTEYCSEPYIRESYGRNAFLDCNKPQDKDIQPILREEVEIAPKTEKSSELIVLIVYQRSR